MVELRLLANALPVGLGISYLDFITGIRLLICDCESKNADSLGLDLSKIVPPLHGELFRLLVIDPEPVPAYGCIGA